MADKCPKCDATLVREYELEKCCYCGAENPDHPTDPFKRIATLEAECIEYRHDVDAATCKIGGLTARAEKAEAELARVRLELAYYQQVGSAVYDPIGRAALQYRIAELEGKP